MKILSVVFLLQNESLNLLLRFRCFIYLGIYNWSQSYENINKFNILSSGQGWCLDNFPKNNQFFLQKHHPYQVKRLLNKYVSYYPISSDRLYHMFSFLFPFYLKILLTHKTTIFNHILYRIKHVGDPSANSLLV